MALKHKQLFPAAREDWAGNLFPTLVTLRRTRKIKVGRIYDAKIGSWAASIQRIQRVTLTLCFLCHVFQRSLITQRISKDDSRCLVLADVRGVKGWS